MISKNKIKLIHALAQKKQRYSQHLFVAEGHKVVEDLLSRFECTYLAAKKDWLEEKQQFVSHLHHKGTEIQEVNDDELTRASLLKTPQDVLAIFRIPENDEADRTLPERELCLALDGIQDPGNMGTIVRIADWFGITHIWCSQDTAWPEYRCIPRICRLFYTPYLPTYRYTAPSLTARTCTDRICLRMVSSSWEMKETASAGL